MMKLAQEKFVEFAEDSDFHGLKYVVRRQIACRRRVVWVFMCVAAVVGFAIFTSFRLSYYFSYPYNTNVRVDLAGITIPGIAVCPDEIHKMTMPSPDTWISSGQYSTEDLAYFLDEWYLSRIITYNYGQQHIAIINSEMVKFIKDLSKANYTTQKNTMQSKPVKEAFFNTLITSLVDRYEIGMFMSTVSSLNASVQWNHTDYFPKFMMRYGVKSEDLTACGIVDGKTHAPTDCKPYLTPIMTDSGWCLAMESINGTDITFDMDADVENYIQLWLTDAYDFSVYTYDKSEGQLEFYHNRVGFHDVRSEQDNQLNRVVVFNSLAEPFHTESCSKSRRSTCIEKCISRLSPCSYFYLNPHGSALKLMCEQLRQYFRPKHNAPCMATCPKPCSKKKFIITTSDGLYEQRYFILKSSKNLYLQQFLQEPIYTADALLAELGGTVGLFLGASLLTMFHCIESIVAAVGKLFFHYYTICRQYYTGNDANLTL